MLRRIDLHPYSATRTLRLVFRNWVEARPMLEKDLIVSKGFLRDIEEYMELYHVGEQFLTSVIHD